MLGIEGKRIFITGGAGFIANCIIKKLVVDNTIIVYDNFSRDTLSNSDVVNHSNLKVIKGDVLDRGKLHDSMLGAQIVIHAAGVAGIDTVIKDPVKTMTVNMIGTANVLEGCKNLNYLEKFVDFSTSEILGGSAYNVTETANSVIESAGEARWCYAVSKLAGEHLAKAYYTKYRMPTVVVRPFNVYGPGQTGEGAIQVFIKKALKGETIQIYGDGSQIRSWCYIDDFVDCLMRILISEKSVGQSFNIGNPQETTTISALAKEVSRTVNEVRIQYKDALSADIALRIPSIEKAKTLLGYKPKISLEEGIRRTASWLRTI